MPAKRNFWLASSAAYTLKWAQLAFASPGLASASSQALASQSRFSFTQPAQFCVVSTEMNHLSASLAGGASASTKAELEDLYLPYKPKRRTKGQAAREKGLEPLAACLLADRSKDPEAEAAIFAELKENLKGRIGIVISHRFSTVRIADRIAVIADGKVSELGSHEELIKASGRYSALFELQAAGYR